MAPVAPTPSSHAISPTCPLELQTAPGHGACHAKCIHTPSALPAPWSSGRFPSVLPSTFNHLSFFIALVTTHSLISPSNHSANLHLLHFHICLQTHIDTHTVISHGVLFQTASEHSAGQAKSIPAPSAKYPVGPLADCFRGWRLSHHTHSHAVNQACPVELLAASQNSASHAKPIPVPSASPPSLRS